MLKHDFPYYEFGPFRLDSKSLKMSSDGAMAHLVPKAHELLLILVLNKGKVLSKDHLLKLLWPDIIVTEANLSQTVYLLRKALGDTSETQLYIQTVPKQGYCFIADVQEIHEVATEQPVTIEPRLNSDTLNEAVHAADSQTQLEGDGIALQPQASGEPLSSGKKIPSPKKGFRARRIVVAPSALLFIIGLILFIAYVRSAKESGWPVPQQAVNSLAVFPFKDINPGPTEKNLGLGMADIIITKLSGLGHLSVRPTSSVLKYMDTGYDSLAAGHEMQVDAVLEGTVQRIEDRVRLSIRLLRVADGQTLWAEVFDEPLKDLFNVQDTLAERVAQTLSRNLNNDERDRSEKLHPVSAEAHEAYARGLYFWNKDTYDGYEKSIRYFSEAIAKEPDYALAYAGLADVYGMLGLISFDQARRKEMFDNARRMALRAKQLDKDIPEAYVAHFLVKHYYDMDMEGAEKEIKQAIQLDQASAIAHMRYAFFLRDTGNLQQAQEELQLTLRLEPLSWRGNIGLCNVLYYKGEYELALEYCRKGVETEPNSMIGQMRIGCILTEKKRYNEAILTLENLLDQHPEAVLFHGDLGYVYAKAGRKREAVQQLRKLESMNEFPGIHYKQALIYVGLGDHDRAIRQLEIEQRDAIHFLTNLRFDPRLSALRFSSKFSERLNRML